MSAQVIPFPSNARHLHKVREAVSRSIATRADEVGATMDEKRAALAAAFKVMARGESAAWAIAIGKDMLPRPLIGSRRPTQPFPPSAA